LTQLGFEVDLVYENRANIQFEGVRNEYKLVFPRSLFNLKLLSTYFQLRKIITEGEYDVVHCHTPIPSALTRLAANKVRRKGITKVIYTAHGFHFFKNAPIINWIIYYPLEYFLSWFTDIIIVLNREDLGYINGKMFHEESKFLLGIGADNLKFHPRSELEKQQIRRNLGYTEYDFILLYVAEFIPRKNHKFIVKSVASLQNKIPNLKVLFAGKGVLMEKIRKVVVKNNLNECVEFLGFRNDISELAAISDIGISSSKHEGLGLGVVEQLMTGIPVVVTFDRGHLESVHHGWNGYLFPQGNNVVFEKYILDLYHNTNRRKAFGLAALKVSEKFKIEFPLNAMKEIYTEQLEKNNPHSIL
jgi:glycosyltransferase EpsD